MNVRIGVPAPQAKLLDISVAPETKMDWQAFVFDTNLELHVEYYRWDPSMKSPHD